MKAKKFLAIVGICIAGSAALTSCVEKNYYVNPNNNYYNHNDSGLTYVFDEEFNGQDYYGWTFTNVTDSAYASIQNGSYQYVDYSATQSNMTVVNTGANVSGNFTVQTRIESNHIMGLIIGASSTSNGYAFYIDTAGNYSLYQEGLDTAASTVLIPSTADSTAVKDGYNILEVDQANGTWTGYINGTQVFQRTAPTLSGASFGFKILPGTVGYADYIVVKSTQ